MFRPFPADLIVRLLAGKKGVVVMERTDQPLAVDPPLLREIRAAMSKARGEWSRQSVARRCRTRACSAMRAEQVPDFFSACFGLGSRDLQPGDIIAAVDNMLPGNARTRQFYLGIDFMREGTRVPKLQIWQEKLLDSYPHLRELALHSTGDLNLLPAGLDRAAHPLGRRLGRDHDGQEPRDDRVRAARAAHQGESEVRLGEEGTADDVLRGVRARARSGSTASSVTSTSCSRPTRTSSATAIHSTGSRRAACS